MTETVKKANGSILSKVKPVYPDFHKPPTISGTQGSTDQVRSRLRYWGLSDKLPMGIVFAPDVIKQQYLQESIRWEKVRRRTACEPFPGCQNG